MSAAITYRPEIDGLRAVAVLAVVLFHAKLGPFTGGYVGVDVFFVISGFLITSIVVREIKAQTFSFADFYERRIRRIFPALFVIMFAAFVAGWFLLTPKDYQDFARSAMNTSVFVSNFAFNQHAGYFAPASDTQPLLHTWSLAVEEQFYVIAPVALLLLYRLTPRQRVGIFAVIFFASLAAAEFGVRNESSWAFYLVHARAWELMVGMALALGIVPDLRSRVGAEALGLAGLGLIALAIFRYTPETAFPGLAALAPCIGAGLVISSTSQQSTLVQRVLATAPMVLSSFPSPIAEL
ncbi:MAG TPA: acyltransferase, partial [Hyphomicrobium sp.]|nr:acyltransferase [Hyphomicrobium sp.]